LVMAGSRRISARRMRSVSDMSPKRN
jgi:hypothetical protein